MTVLSTTVSLDDRFAGSLVGQCVGDALGFVVEGCTAQLCARFVETELRRGKAGRRGRPPYEFGQYTDDSQLTRTLLESVVARDGFDPSDYAARIAGLFREDRIVGRGRTTEEAARRLIAGVPWDRAGTPAPAAGNGSAMRAAPVGLVFRGDMERLARAAHDQGRITHADPRCSAGAVAIAAAVALAARGEAPDAAAWTPVLADLAARHDADFAEAISALADIVDLPPEDAATLISRLGWEPETQVAFEGISPFVVPSVMWSLYSVFRNPESYWETICTAIVAGGDVDTTAAMAGAISGAYLGIDAVPPDLAARLADNGRWQLSDLAELARKARRISV
jgi:ADP-ribosylglycohydrolase